MRTFLMSVPQLNAFLMQVKYYKLDVDEVQVRYQTLGCPVAFLEISHKPLP